MVEAADAATYTVLDGKNHFHVNGGDSSIRTPEDAEAARLALVGGVCTEPALPTKRPHLTDRWKILVLLCLGLIGSYYCYDIPTAINVVMGPYYIPRIGQKRYNLLYNSLYSVYSWPNVVLPLLGGYFSDLWGVRLTTVIFALLILIGQIIFAVGITIEDDNVAWGIMLFGRVVFGLGGESLSVSMSAMIAQWFQGKEIALALGVNLALARYGSVINDEASLALAKHLNMAWALWAGVLVCVMSLGAAIWAYYIDVAAVQVLRENRKTLRRTANGGASRNLRGAAAAAASGTEQGQLRLRNGAGDKPGSGSSTAPGPDRRTSEASSLLMGDDDDPDKEGLEDETIDLRAIFTFPATFWVLTLSCLTVYCAVLPFNNIASDFLKLKWDLEDETANTYMLVIYLTAGSLSPFLGAAIDNLGQRARLNVVAAVMIALVHTALGFTHWNPVLPLVTLGLTYCIYASALWPSIALVVPEEYAATAYGLVTAVQNLGLAAVPLAVGRLQASCPETYTCVEVFFIAAGVAGTASGLALNAVDACEEHPKLNLSAAQLVLLKKAQEDAEKQGLLGAGDAAERGSVSGYSMQGIGAGRGGSGLAVGISGADSPTYAGSDGGAQRIPRASDASSRKAREAGLAEDSPLARSLLPTPTLGNGAGSRPSALDDLDIGSPAVGRGGQ